VNELIKRDPVLVKLEAARQYLAEATDLAEVKNVADVAASAEVYARRQQLGDEAIGFAHRVKTDALARLGELLRDVTKAKGAAAGGKKESSRGTYTELRDGAPTLADYGISKKVASVAQQLAALPPDVREEIASGEMSLEQVRRESKERHRESRREENRQKIATVAEPQQIVGVAKFATIVIDPPWDWGDEGDQDQFGRARPDYATLSLSQLAALPVTELADDDCHLYLWITNRSLPKGFALLEQWGFRYVTCLTWCKPSIGMGNYFRGSTEHLLFGVRGSQALRRRDLGTWFPAPRPGEHSAKPPEAYELIENASPGPYLEMFARSERDGWTQWGEHDAAA
jgi:N6-adenosine-specific RNA methylase IME4